MSLFSDQKEKLFATVRAGLSNQATTKYCERRSFNESKSMTFFSVIPQAEYCCNEFEKEDGHNHNIVALKLIWTSSMTTLSETFAKR